MDDVIVWRIQNSSNMSNEVIVAKKCNLIGELNNFRGLFNMKTYCNIFASYVSHNMSVNVF